MEMESMEVFGIFFFLSNRKETKSVIYICVCVLITMFSFCFTHWRNRRNCTPMISSISCMSLGYKLLGYSFYRYKINVCFNQYFHQLASDYTIRKKHH